MYGFLPNVHKPQLEDLQGWVLPTYIQACLPPSGLWRTIAHFVQIFYSAVKRITEDNNLFMAFIWFCNNFQVGTFFAIEYVSYYFIKRGKTSPSFNKTSLAHWHTSISSVKTDERWQLMSKPCIWEQILLLVLSMHSLFFFSALIPYIFRTHIAI